MQPRFRPVIRVFVSSTFTDLKHERNALQEKVFPELERFCAKRKFQFQAIDLRWGVSSEANLDHRTMRICFEELRRAQEVSPRPNFLILLGNRYGWRPLLEQVFPDEFERLEQVASGAERAILRNWYRCDDNELRPVYLLRSRRQSLNDGKDYTDEKVWQNVQKVLWDIINRAYPPSLLNSRFKHLVNLSEPLPSVMRFQASATEQEIWRGAFGVPDANEHVFAFIREIENIRDYSNPAEIRDFVDVDENRQIDEVAQKALKELKDFLKGHLRNNVYEYSNVYLQGKPVDVTTQHLDKFCEQVLASLKEIINQQINEFWGTEAIEIPKERELELEKQEHWRFSQERAPEQSFIGRERELKVIQDYISGKSRRILVVHGASGCGKTALLARASQQLKDKEPIIRFIGLTPNSSDVRSLLSSICQELRQRNNLSTPIPDDFNKLVEEFQGHLFMAQAKKPIMLFLDGLDQLSESNQGLELKWLPKGDLPEHTKIIVSCISDLAQDDPTGKPYQVLKTRKIGEPEFLSLDVLSEEQAQKLIFERWLPQAGRRLNTEQEKSIKRLLVSEQCRAPLYLRILFEEIRLWHSYDPVPELPRDVFGLISAMLKRLAKPTNHGKTVEFALSYIVSARRGLSENEILEVLYADKDYYRFLQETAEKTKHELPSWSKRIPIAIWSRLRYDLAPYLSEHSAPGAIVLNFYHRQMINCLQDLFISDTTIAKQFRERLANYFEARFVDKRQADELAWLLQKIEDKKRLKECLLDIDRFLLMQKYDENELRSYWVWLKEEKTMGKEYLERFNNWAKNKLFDIQIFYTANQLGLFLLHSALYKEAEPLLRRALEMTEKNFGKDHLEVANCFNNLAQLLKATNRFKEAESLMRRALEITERNFGKYHPQVALYLNNLALLLMETDRHNEAEPLARRALEITERNFGKYHPQVALCLNNLALLLIETNRFNEAEPLIRHALEITKRSLGKDHPNVAVNLNNLALLLIETNRFKEAEPLIRHALEITERSLGKDHPNVAVNLSNLVLLLRGTNRFNEAESLMRRALEITEKSLSKDHPNVAIRLNNLAMLLKDTNRFNEAEPLLCRALEILLKFTSSSGHPHPKLQTLLNNYADLLKAIGRSTEEIHRTLKDLCARFGIDFVDTVEQISSAIPPRFRPIIEQISRDPTKITEIMEKLQKDDPALYLELHKWIQSQLRK